MNGGEDTSEENDSDRGETLDEDNNTITNTDDATDYNQISQSAVESNEPPFPLREGGRG
jgi:hypothetical protein